MNAGGEHLLKGTPVYDVCETGPLQCWLIRIDNVIGKPEIQQELSRMSHRLMEASQTLHAPNSPQTADTYYKSINASRWPCSCKYYHDGWIPGKHRGEMYSIADDQRLNRLETAARPELKKILQPLIKGMASRLNVFESLLPSYVVGNLYPESSSFIGVHSDDGELFGSHSGPTVIFSLTLNRDSVFVIKPNYNKEPQVRSDFQIPKTKPKRSYKGSWIGNSVCGI